MPTAVEFQIGGAYAESVLGRRGISPTLVNAVVAKGGGTAIAEGKTIYQWTWASASGHRWTTFVVTNGPKILSSWIEQG